MPAPSDNPLLQPKFHIPFDVIRAEHVVPAVEHFIDEAKAAIDEIGSRAGPRTWDDTMGALEKATEPIEWVMGVVSHLEAVAATEALQQAHLEVRPRVSELYSSIPLEPKLWSALEQYAATDEARQLTGARARLLRKTIEEFKRHGAELPEQDKEKLKKMVVALSEATTRFAQNVLESTNAFELVLTDEAQLSGLPASAIAAAAADAQEKEIEGWRFTLHAPSLMPLLTYLDDAGIREQVWRAYNTRATREPHDNRPLIVEILDSRRRQAELLGFANFADLVLEDRMAHDSARVREFLGDLRARTEDAFAREKQALWDFRKSIEGAGAPAPEAWDVAYYAEKMRKTEYDFDEEDLRPYFPLDSVVSGMFEIVNRLYGIELRETDSLPKWHPDVLTYEVLERDSESEPGADQPLRSLGCFYADFHPRDDKRGGAWMHGLITGDPAREQPHLGLICGNLTKPLDGAPALLTHREVETIFHEFGHLLHHMLSRVELRSLAGTRVAWDFVELPSQIMENWTWEREALNLFALHYETGEPIPDLLFDKMDRARKFRAASAMMRQLGFATVDFGLHLDYDAERDGDLLAKARELALPFATSALPEPHGMICGFTHLFAHPVGYASGYYSYKWAEVLDADAFTAFKRGGVFSRSVGLRFRNTILARGDAKDPIELYRDFMGRDPELEALLERSGLLEAG